MPRLSVVIVAKDEERTIGSVLAAVKDIADEMIVVDSGSTDATPEIARSLGARVSHQDWLGYAAQKNHAIDLACGDWILSLDADEILTPEAVREIDALLKSSAAHECDGYLIPRVLYVGDRALRHGGFFPDAQLRLFQKGKGRFKERMVHERIFVEGKVGRLINPMNHFAYKNLEEFSAAMEKYARLSAMEYRQDGSHSWRANALNEYLHPAWTFFLRYFLRLGFLDGAMGLKVNLAYSIYVRNKIRYLRKELAGSEGSS
ncbi:MAG TPA: glycosyltransferase family 2 protein [Candidatus Obscuribacterales bacterium]